MKKMLSSISEVRNSVRTVRLLLVLAVVLAVIVLCAITLRAQYTPNPGYPSTQYWNQFSSANVTNTAWTNNSGFNVALAVTNATGLAVFNGNGTLLAFYPNITNGTVILPKARAYITNTVLNASAYPF
jgi:hypothetical protein